MYTSPICLAISFYFAEKKHGAIFAKQKVELFCKHLRITDNDRDDVTRVLKDKRIHDFEDGLEYYAAEKQKCKCIVTENLDDFYFSQIQVLSCADFIKQHVLN